MLILLLLLLLLLLGNAGEEAFALDPGVDDRPKRGHGIGATAAACRRSGGQQLCHGDGLGSKALQFVSPSGLAQAIAARLPRGRGGAGELDRFEPEQRVQSELRQLEWLVARPRCVWTP